jgi:uncharacterized protein YfbU (UPF0304 family)
LLNQYRILEKVDPDQADSWSEAAEIVENGYTLEYDTLATGFDEEVSPEVCREVMDILDMFRMLQNAIRPLPAASAIDRRKAEFRGFDGNAGTGHYGYARFVMEIQDRWKDVKPDDLNSHSDTLPRYRAMLSAWKESAEKTELTADDVTRILAAED